MPKVKAQAAPKVSGNSKAISQSSNKSNKKAAVKNAPTKGAPAPIKEAPVAIKEATKQIKKAPKKAKTPKEPVDKRPSAPPKKANTAYICFNIEMMNQMKGMEKFKDLTLGPRVKIVGQSWAKLDEEQKQDYVDRAEEDKKRFAEQTDQVKRNGFFINAEGQDSRDIYKPPKVKKEEAPVQNEMVDADDAADKDIKGTSKSKESSKQEEKVKEKKKDNICRPKKALSSYIFFTMDNRSKVQKENPEISMCDISKVNGQDWLKLTDAQKEKYVKQSEQDQVRHAKEQKEFEEFGYFINSDGIKSTFLNKKHTAQEFTADTVMPKKPRSNYMCYFCEEQYRMIHLTPKEGKNTIVENTRLISENWHKLTDKVKQKYDKLHEKDVQRYNDQLDEIRKNGFFMTSDGIKSTDLPVKVPKQKRVKRVQKTPAE